ncbi:hypothetical protein RBU61_05125 [Tissierella sp. MB52-C2]|uniref:hypothetical protein n=1 Tax=Tissierella sp. MB52-C2 TaxID=3070999 RepID=UPI00280BCE24|nr:hypothetical protein [Tissierella sp. MB52-C2]WMM26060.1 hypothetical protein RBU61_05125 [Tissierella sp. MB52-C2]
MKAKDILKIFISILSFFIIGIIILLIIANTINLYNYFNIFIVDFCKIILSILIAFIIFRIKYSKESKKQNYKDYKKQLRLKILFTIFLSVIFIYNAENPIRLYSLMDYKEFYLNCISVIRGSFTLVFILSMITTYLILEYRYIKRSCFKINSP